MGSKHADRPATWLRELARVSPPHWDWGRAIRVSASLAVPMGLGLAFDQFSLSLFVALGALTTAMADGEGSYRSRLWQLAVSSLIGALGFFAGYLNVLPYPVVIAVMSAIAFVAGVVNSYGAAWSIGSMMALLYAAIAIGLPGIAPFWMPAALSLLGVAFFMLMLAAEAMLDRRRPERAMVTGLLAGLAGLARAQADAVPDSVEAARRAVTDRSRALYAAVIANRRGGRTHETLALADVLDAADGLFVVLMAATDPERLTAAAGWLDTLADAIATRAKAPPPPGATGAPDALADALGALAAATGTGAHAGPLDPQPVRPHLRMPWAELKLPHLAVGRTVLRRAAALSLCTGIAYATRYVLHVDHWYWVPLTVAIVMKPEMGSVFVRAVLRCAGTSLGVVAGVALLHVVPPGRDLIVALAVIGAFLPLAKSLSYGVQMLAVTPVVLILLELIAPVPGGIGYGEERFIATLVGGGIVLVFGYFLWPRRHGRELAQQFAAALGATADYLVAVCGNGGDRAKVLAAERAAYARLSDLRAALGRSMAEPPPAGREAAAWFPLVAAAERMCDRITAAASARGAPRPPAAEVAAVAARLRSLGTRAVTPPPSAAVPLSDPLLRALADEAGRLSERLAGTLDVAEAHADGGAATVR
jgi:uncharacterized membrane protein YccC